MNALTRISCKEDQKHYKKVGRKYVQVNDPCATEGLRKGWWLVHVQDGCTSTRAQVHPSRAEIDAAIRENSEKITDILMDASKPELQKSIPISPELQSDWNAFIAKHGKEMAKVYYPSIYDVAEKIIIELTKR